MGTEDVSEGGMSKGISFRSRGTTPALEERMFENVSGAQNINMLEREAEVKMARQYCEEKTGPWGWDGAGDALY